MLARLCLLPPLAGFRRVFRPKPNRFVQCDKSSGERVILLSSPENAVQLVGLADLGMCLMIGPFTEGWMKVGVLGLAKCAMD